MSHDECTYEVYGGTFTFKTFTFNLRHVYMLTYSYGDQGIIEAVKFPDRHPEYGKVLAEPLACRGEMQGPEFTFQFSPMEFSKVAPIVEVPSIELPLYVGWNVTDRYRRMLSNLEVV